MIWPESFEKGKVDPKAPKAQLVADGLSAWAICMSGGTPIEKFGEVMVEIGARLNISPTSENLMEYSKTMTDKDYKEV